MWQWHVESTWEFWQVPIIRPAHPRSGLAVQACLRWDQRSNEQPVDSATSASQLQLEKRLYAAAAIAVYTALVGVFYRASESCPDEPFNEPLAGPCSCVGRCVGPQRAKLGGQPSV